MKKFICSIVVLLAAVIIYSPGIQAQDHGVDTVWLSLSAGARQIVVSPTDVRVNLDGDIVFCTNSNHTFTVIIDNYDGFIDNPVTFLIFNVSAENSVKISIGSPPKDDSTKVYSVGTIDRRPPLPPAAPPRIILNQQ